MSSETRLADIVAALEVAGLKCLVMGGHAVRFYGLDRNTNDFDLHLAPENWDELTHRLRQTSLFGGQSPIEGPSWRPNVFRRFQVGVLASGREEWLEFWKHNHLLSPFGELFLRRQVGRYGDRDLPFMSLADLLRSKETEREADWVDIGFLEEFHDARLLAAVVAGECSLTSALAQLRSRRGFENHIQRGHLNDAVAMKDALSLSRFSVTQAFLMPFIGDLTTAPEPTVPLEPVVFQHLRAVEPGSNLHLALVEVVRRQYKLAAQAADRADKQAFRRDESK